MHRTLLSFIAIILLATFVQAQEAPAPDVAQPKSVAAKNAETKFNADMQKLDEDYQQKAAAIKQFYVDGLKTALKNIAKSDNADPDEIANLSAKIKEVQATMVAVPVATQKVKRISGKWKETWNRGKSECIFKKDRIVYFQTETHPWMQDGSDVIIYYKGGWDHMVLSKDGTIMNGFNTINTPITYTFVGD